MEETTGTTPTTTSTTSWTPLAHADYDLLVGKAVYTPDGAHIGAVTSVFHPEPQAPQVGAGHVAVVEPAGSPEAVVDAALYVPKSAIRRVEHDRATLNVTREELRGEIWQTAPPGFDRDRLG